ncbi:MAG: glycosyltransferase family 2 protein [Planctomycetes bacterium]|nr:glycosyltransferase family 2 protein [Planctomycetota bacterium]
MKLSVVIPVYNEEATLAEIVRRVQATPFDKEILLVDDGSRDRSREIMEALAREHPNVRCFRHATNSGKGAALSTGFAHVTGDVVLIQDADLEYDPSDYGALLAPILEGQADVVFGSRFLGGRYARVHLYWHYVGNRLLTTVSNMFTNLNLSDMETCYKVFRREVADRIQIRSRTFAVEPEFAAKVAKLRARVYEVPISYAGRDYSEGKKIGLRDAFIALWAIVRWSVFHRLEPLRRARG